LRKKRINFATREEVQIGIIASPQATASETRGDANSDVPGIANIGPGCWSLSHAGNGHKVLCCSHFVALSCKVICPTGGSREFLSSPLAKNIWLPFFGNLCFAARVPPRWRGALRGRHEREAGCGGRSGAWDERFPVADGEAVWFWRPLAGVKFARRQRVARMTGSTKQVVPGKSAE